MRILSSCVMWQRHTEAGARAVDHGDGAVVQIDDGLRDGESEAGAATLARRVAAVEAVEDVVPRRGGDTGSVVAHLEDGLVAVRPGADPHPGARAAVLDG